MKPSVLHTFTLLLLLMLATASARPAMAQRFRQLSMADGLSQLSVMAICQDRAGRMWFGTDEGINVFDGNTIVAIKQFGSITSGNTEVRDICSDADGNLYFRLGSTVVRHDYRTQAFSSLVRSGATALWAKGGSVWYAISGDVYTIQLPQDVAKPMPAAQRVVHMGGTRVFSIFCDRSGTLWLGARDGLYALRRGQRVPRKTISTQYAEYICQDSRGNLWVSTRSSGCFRIAADGTRTHFTASAEGAQPNAGSEARVQKTLSSNLVRQICEAADGRIWIGTFMGLDVYDPQTGLFTVYTHTNRRGSLGHPSVYPIVRDTYGTMWVGTYYGGVNYTNPDDNAIRFYTADDQSASSLSYPFVGHMAYDRRGDLWVCTEGGGLNRIDHATHRIDRFLMGSGPNSLPQNNLKCIAYDRRRDRLFIGTHLGGLSVLDIATMRFDNPMLSRPGYAQKYGDRIVDMAMWGDKLIFTSQKGIWTLDPSTMAITPTTSQSIANTEAYLHVDRHGCLWMCDEGAVYRVLMPSGRLAATYRCGTHGLGRHQLRRVAEDAQGRIYVVTSGGGIYRLDQRTGTFSNFSTANSGILSDFCYDMCQADGGMMVYSTDRGIGFFNTKDDRFRNVEFSKDFPLTGIHKWCGLLAHGDMIYAGGTNGLAAFGMKRMLAPKKADSLYMSRIVINGHNCTPGDGTGVIDEAVYLTRRINLNYDQNNITFWFASRRNADDITRPVYEYRLKGYDNTWYATTSRSITYPKLPAGEYRLEIREKTAAWQNAADACRLAMDVEVTPPLYRSTVAYILYVMMFLGMVYAFYHFKRSQLLLETSLAMEKKDKQNIEALNRAKLQFFTSISHEFRTPLTLIIAKLDYLMQTVARTSTVGANLKSISQNAGQMLELVNELMDFRKMEQGHTRLAIAQCDMVEFVRDITTAFDELARSRSIDYSFHASQAQIMCWFDRRQMQKVVYNLISNAFKFVSTGTGIIEVRLDTDGEGVTLRVIDNGVGIAKKDIHRIFDRFYQAEGDIGKVAAMRGTGIGLALVRQIVERHHGTVEVLSSEGCGSIFVVRLKTGTRQFDGDSMCDVLADGPADGVQPTGGGSVADAGRQAAVPAADGGTAASAGTHETPDGDTRQKLLVVEDNDELLATLGEIFAPMYDVSTAHDGQEALDKARTLMPDAIVSDIMMPVMDGMQMCRALKNDIAVSHIPVLLLTAMGAAEQEVEGLRCGADDYVAKPFNPAVLIARVGALLRMRAMLQKRMQQDDTSMADAKNFATNRLDRQFIEQCDRFIAGHLLDSDFSVDDMARHLSMSRTSFFAKFKALTGQTPGDYIIAQKLGRAAQKLHDEPTATIADVAYAFGFSTPRYFSQCFKKRYGKNPTEWRSATGTPVKKT